MKKNIEHKAMGGRIEVKFAADQADTKTFDGYGAYFNNVDAYGDVIQPGAFAKSVSDFKSRNAMPAMLWNHDAQSRPIGIWMDMEEDAKGLKVSGQFLPTAEGNDTYTIVKAGAVTGLSIGYFVTGFEIVKSGNDVSRLITEVKLFEISVVTFPANQMAQIADVKSMDDDGDDDGDCDCDDPDRDPDDPACDDCDDDDLYNSLTAKGFDPEMTKTFIASRKAKKADDMEDDDAEDDEETKYNKQAIEAMRNLCLKLKQENHG